MQRSEPGEVSLNVTEMNDKLLKLKNVFTQNTEYIFCKINVRSVVALQSALQWLYFFEYSVYYIGR